MSSNNTSLNTSSQSTFDGAVRAAQLAMNNLIAREKLLAEKKCDELDAADARHQERLARSRNTIKSRANQATTVETLVIDSISRSNITERAKFETAFKTMRNVEHALENRQNDVELLYKLLLITENPTPDIVAALEGLRGVLRYPISKDAAFTAEERSLLLRNEEPENSDWL